MTCIHHQSITYSFTDLKILSAPPIHPPLASTLLFKLENPVAGRCIKAQDAHGRLCFNKLFGEGIKEYNWSLKMIHGLQFHPSH